MGQLANALSSKPQGSLPSDTEANPRRKGKEHCITITLRSAKQLPETSSSGVHKEAINKEDERVGEETSLQDEVGKNDKPQNTYKKVEVKAQNKLKKKVPPKFTPSLPFSQLFRKQYLDAQYKKFLDIFK